MRFLLRFFRFFRVPRKANPSDIAAVMYDTLKRVERLIAFDLNRMIVFGDGYNQAVRDVFDAVVASRRLYEEEGRNDRS